MQSAFREWKCVAEEQNVKNMLPVSPYLLSRTAGYELDPSLFLLQKERESSTNDQSPYYAYHRRQMNATAPMKHRTL
jgi:hypothetical protein